MNPRNSSLVARRTRLIGAVVILTGAVATVPLNALRAGAAPGTILYASTGGTAA